MLILFIIVGYPLSTLLYGSFRDAPPGEPGKFSFGPYFSACNQENVPLIVNSVVVSLISLMVALPVGSFLAFLLSRTDFPWRNRMEGLIITPYFIPLLLYSLAWRWLASPINGILMSSFNLSTPPLNINSLWGMGWVQGIFYTPLVYTFIGASLKMMNSEIEDSARIGGANNSQTFLNITLPLILPTVTSSALLIFVLVITGFSTAAIIGLPARIYLFPTKIYELVSVYPPEINVATALSMIVILLVAFILLLRIKIVKTKLERYATITGRGRRYTPIRLEGKQKYVALASCLIYLLMALFLPIFILIFSSFLRFFTFDPSSWVFALDNYYSITKIPGVKLSLINSIIYSTTAATLSIILAFFISYIQVKRRSISSKISGFLVTIPVCVPAIVFAVGLLWAWIRVPYVYGTPWILIMAYIASYLPYSVNSASACLLKVGNEIEESARICGSSWLVALLRVIFPLIKSGLLGSWVLLFVVFFRETACSVLLCKAGTKVVAFEIYELWGNGTWGELCAMSIFVFIVIFGALAIARKFGWTVRIGV